MEWIQLTEWDRIAANVNAKNGDAEADGSEEATSTRSWTPKSIQYGVQKIPLVPVCHTKLSLHSSSGANSEKED